MCNCFRMIKKKMFANIIIGWSRVNRGGTGVVAENKYALEYF